MTPAPNESNGQPASDTGKAHLYRVAYSEAMRALDDQRDELSGVRGRAAQFLAFVGSATAFLVGTGLAGAGDRDTKFYIVAWIATGLTGLSIVACALVLNPARKFGYRANPRIIVEKWIGSDVPRPTEGDLLRELALHYDDVMAENNNTLYWLRWQYGTVIIAGALGLVGWAVLAWMNG